MNNNKPFNETERLAAAFRHSLDGLTSVHSHPAFRLEIILFCILAPLALLLADNGIELALMVGSLLLVMIVELLNTGIEKAIDRISSDWHDLSKQAKDIGSAAVLLSLANAVVVWLSICLF